MTFRSKRCVLTATVTTFRCYLRSTYSNSKATAHPSKCYRIPFTMTWCLILIFLRFHKKVIVRRGELLRPIMICFPVLLWDLKLLQSEALVE